MITVWGEGRGFRVIWLLEEMGLPYRLRDVDLLADGSKGTEFLAINPAGFIPAIVDGEVTMVESIAILQYLTARYGPTPLAVTPDDPAYPAYLQFLLMGEAGLAGPMNAVSVSRNLAPEGERDDFTARWALRTYESRADLVRRRLEQMPYLAGDRFTAADISVVYALVMAQRIIGMRFDATMLDYIARTTGRASFGRAMDACPATKSWATKAAERWGL